MRDMHRLKFKYFLFLLSGILFVNMLNGQTATRKSITLTASEEKSKPTVQLLQSSSQQVVFSVKIPTIDSGKVILNKERYTAFSIDNFSEIAVPGKPALPTMGQMIAIPGNADINIVIENARFIEIDQISIPPVQKPLSESYKDKKNEFVIDEMVYRADSFYPSELAWVEPAKIIRGNAVTILWIAPVQYNPVKQKVRIYTEYKVTVNFSGNTTSALDAKYHSPQFQKLLKNLVVNKNSIIQSNLDNRPVFDGSNKNTYGCDYLVITHREFESAAIKLAEWRNLCGLETKIVFVEDIGSTSDEIREYIIYAYENWHLVPTYILLLGDSEFVPVNYYTEHPSEGSGMVATDLYYVAIDGSDYFPDLFTGRIPVETSEQALTFVEKVINYEKNPVTDPDFYNNAAILAYFQDNDDDDTPDYNERDGYEERRFVLTSEEIRDFLMTTGYNATRIYNCEHEVNPTHYNNSGYANGEPLPAELLRQNGFQWDGNASDINQAIHQGCFLVSHRDHGNRSGWGDPAYNRSNVAALNNGDLLPLVFSTNCETGWFDNETDLASTQTNAGSECFVEYWLRNENGGAMGVFGSTRISYSGYNDALALGFFDAIWPEFLAYESSTQQEPITRMSQVLNYGKLFMATQFSSGRTRKIEFEEFHYYGDPASILWTKMPENLTINSIDSCFFNQTELAVSVSEANAIVTLVQDGKIIASGLTNNSGNIDFVFAPLSSANSVQICITKENYKPYIQQLNVYSPQNTCVTCQSYSFTDQNQNDEINIGETIQCNFDLLNSGAFDVTGLQLNLKTSDQYITLLDSVALVDSLNINDKVTINSLSFMVKNYCPNNYEVIMDLIIKDSSDFSLTYPIKFLVFNGEPRLQVSPDFITTRVNSLNDSVEVNLELSNHGFGNLELLVKDRNKELIQIGSLERPSWANIPVGSGNIYYIDRDLNLTRFSSYLDVESPLLLYFFVYEGNSLTGTYYKVAESYSDISDLGEKFHWSDIFEVKLQAEKYYYLGISWDSGSAKICRDVTQKVPFNVPIGELKTATVSLGGAPPVDSVEQTRTNINGFVQKVETGQGNWLKRLSCLSTLKPAETIDVPLNFYATHSDSLFSTIIDVISNDPNNDTLSIPVYFSVGDDCSHLICNVGQITDDEGNNNGEINIGEKISLPVKVKNLGAVNAENVLLQLISNDEYLIPIDSLETISVVEADKEHSVDAFEIEISPYCPDNHSVSFTVNLSTNSYSVSYDFSKIVKEGEPIIGIQPDSLTCTISQIDDSLSLPITITNTGFGKLIYQFENPIQKINNTGSIAENQWLPMPNGVSNVYKFHEQAHVLEMQSYLQVDAETSVYFFVYEGDSLNSAYNRICYKKVGLNSTGTGWYSSNRMEFDVFPDKHYYIGCSWTSNVKAGRSSASLPIDIGIGQVVSGGFGLAQYPPVESIYQRFNSFAPKAQRLITGSGWWFSCPVVQDTLFPKESKQIETTFYSVSPDTTFHSSINIFSNDLVHSVGSLPISLCVTDTTMSFVDDVSAVTRSFNLYQNYPNPFNMDTIIRYQISKGCKVSMSIYNLLGQKVIELIDEPQKAGTYQVSWNGRTKLGDIVPTGIYLISLQAEGKSIVRKILLLK